MKIDPTCGASPFGRNSSAVSGNAAKRAWLASVWSRKVWSTVNPFVARRMAGSSESRSDAVPKRSSAASHVASVPGTPTEQPGGHGIGERVPDTERRRGRRDAPGDHEGVARHVRRRRLAAVDRGDLAGRRRRSTRSSRRRRCRSCRARSRRAPPRWRSRHPRRCRRRGAPRGRSRWRIGVDRRDGAAVPGRGGWSRWRGRPAATPVTAVDGGIRGCGCGGGDQPGGHDRGERDGRAPERWTAADDVDHDDPRTGDRLPDAPHRRPVLVPTATGRTERRPWTAVIPTILSVAHGSVPDAAAGRSL